MAGFLSLFLPGAITILSKGLCWPSLFAIRINVVTA